MSYQQGMILWSHRDYIKALDAFSNTLTLKPSHILARMSAVFCMFYTRDLNKAMNYACTILDTVGVSGLIEQQTLLLRARIARHCSDLVLAQQDLDLYSTRFIHSASFYFFQAVSYIRKSLVVDGDGGSSLVLADTYLRRALQLASEPNTNDLSLHYIIVKLALIYEIKHDYHTALSYLATALSTLVSDNDNNTLTTTTKKINSDVKQQNTTSSSNITNPVNLPNNNNLKQKQQKQQQQLAYIYIKRGWVHLQLGIIDSAHDDFQTAYRMAGSSGNKVAMNDMRHVSRDVFYQWLKFTCLWKSMISDSDSESDTEQHLKKIMSKTLEHVQTVYAQISKPGNLQVFFNTSISFLFS